MTAVQDRLRELLEKATPGKWQMVTTAHEPECGLQGGEIQMWSEIPDEEIPGDCEVRSLITVNSVEELSAADVLLMCEMKNALPALLSPEWQAMADENARLRAEVDRLVYWVNRVDMAFSKPNWKEGPTPQEVSVELVSVTSELGFTGEDKCAESYATAYESATTETERTRPCFLPVHVSNARFVEDDPSFLAAATPPLTPGEPVSRMPRNEKGWCLYQDGEFFDVYLDGKLIVQFDEEGNGSKNRADAERYLSDHGAPHFATPPTDKEGA
jgi:hypothetical protein